MRKTLASCLGLAALAYSTACKDVPFLPKWDADWYLPIGTRAVHLKDVFPFGYIPPRVSANIISEVYHQNISGTFKEVLDNIVTDPQRARTFVELTLSQTAGIQIEDTLYIARDSLGLTQSRPENIVLPIVLRSNDSTKTDSLYISPESIRMLQEAAANSSGIWIQLRGMVSNPGNSIAISNSDSISAKAGLYIRIAVSQ